MIAQSFCAVVVAHSCLNIGCGSPVPFSSCFLLFCFCTGIREERPSREILKEYFAVGTEESRHWHGLSLAQAVQKGLDLSARHPQKAPFMWLTAYNSGAARVALAALSLLGISQEDLDAGFPSDPSLPLASNSPIL